MPYILETHNLTKAYKDFYALRNLNMQIEKGAIYGFIGKNGAGKTTLIRLLTGLQHPSEGEFTLYGISSKSKEIHRVRRQIAAIIEKPAVYLNLSAYDNLKVQAQNAGLPSYQNIEDILQLVSLAQVKEKKVKNFSLGMKQRLGIAIALISNPDLLLLDEPTNGLDPQGIVEMRELILKLNKEKGITVLISSHYLDELSKLATHYGFLDKGTMVRQICAKEWKQACGKQVELQVSDTKKCVVYLEQRQLPYTIIDEHHLRIHQDVHLTVLVEALAKQQCVVEACTVKEESLESYYMNLVGGQGNV